MPDKMMPGPVQDAACIREAVCIHTKKIYDSCKEEDIASYIVILEYHYLLIKFSVIPITELYTQHFTNAFPRTVNSILYFLMCNVLPALKSA